MQSNIEEETLFTRRGERDNGNEIGENTTIVKRGSRNGIHINRASNQQGTIYMHYVMVWWYKEKIQPLMRGYNGLVVYADDFVACLQYKSDAQMFYELLKKRMGHFGLELQEEKSRLIEFGRFAKQNAAKRGRKAETFDFLGFTHYCSVNRNGKFRVKKKTSRKMALQTILLA